MAPFAPGILLLVQVPTYCHYIQNYVGLLLLPYNCYCLVQELRTVLLLLLLLLLRKIEKYRRLSLCQRASPVNGYKQNLYFTFVLTWDLLVFPSTKKAVPLSSYGLTVKLGCPTCARRSTDEGWTLEKTIRHVSDMQSVYLHSPMSQRPDNQATSK